VFKMHLSATRRKTEFKYLEAIGRASTGSKQARTQEIAETLKVAPSSVTPMLEKLSEGGLIEYESHHGACLTEEGMVKLLNLSQRGEVLERFFMLLGMGREIACDQAKGLASIVSDESYRKLKTLNEELELTGLDDLPSFHTRK
jgi:Mn-dependent DtxR family transcriptional regulator